MGAQPALVTPNEAKLIVAPLISSPRGLAVYRVMVGVAPSGM